LHQVVLNTDGSSSYIGKIAKSLLDLMDTRADKKQKIPTHYVSLLWFNGFCGAFFDEHMEWMKRDDPVFGAGSYGNLLVLYQRIYLSCLSIWGH
jgi:hypothetical protein